MFILNALFDTIDVMSKKLSTESYKGVRDFYPEDMFVQNYIFDVWKATLQSFGYEQYDASILEPSELYEAKTGEEIVNEQTYTFIDRGDRKVTLRPEMTPTVARLIAGKRRELDFPVRWFSIPNLFRYERPQKGRLREHWQLNVDMFGLSSIEAEVEVIEIAATILRNFGLSDTDFEIKINSRALINKIFEELGLDAEQKVRLAKLIDKKNKIDDFNSKAMEIVGKEFSFEDIRANEQVSALLDKLRTRGISNVSFSPEVMRGFDYYTDIVFEVFDTSGENNRSIFGGGRYDELTTLFDDEKIPAVGFGQGDVTMRDLLETYKLLPDFVSSADICICPLNDAFFEPASDIASIIREQDVNVSVDYSGKKVGEQIKKADKRKIPFVIVVGDDEVSTQKVTIKNLLSGKEKKVRVGKVGQFINKFVN